RDPLTQHAKVLLDPVRLAVPRVKRNQVGADGMAGLVATSICEIDTVTSANGLRPTVISPTIVNRIYDYRAVSVEHAVLAVVMNIVTADSRLSAGLRVDADEVEREFVIGDVGAGGAHKDAVTTALGDC